MKNGKLSESARLALQHIEMKLSHGFTGRFVLLCSEGGIRSLEQNEQFNMGEIPSETNDNKTKTPSRTA